MPKKYNPALIAAAVSLPLLIGGFSTGASAQSTFTDQTAFDALTNTEKVDIPGPNYAPWGGAKCGGFANTGVGPDIDVSFDGATNNLNATFLPPASALCIFGSGFTIVNTIPDDSGGAWGGQNLLVANGEDDYVVTFTIPVTAFALQLLTNSSNNATITLKDGGGVVIGSSKTASTAGDFAVDANEISAPILTIDYGNEFIGFASTTPIKTVEITTDGGASQNSGVLAFWAGALVDSNINVHPGSDPNPLNLSSGGSTPVVIFGSDLLDVSAINIGQLALASAGVKTVGKSNKELCKITDIGSYEMGLFDSFNETPDGKDDLVCHFVTAELSGELDGTSTTVDLTIIGCTDPTIAGPADTCDPGDTDYFLITETDAIKVVKI